MLKCGVYSIILTAETKSCCVLSKAAQTNGRFIIKYQLHT